MKRYIKEILIGLLSILLIVTIFLLIQQRKRTNEALALIEQVAAENKRQIEENKKIVIQNQIVLDSLITVIAKSESTIVIDKQEYEKTKKSSRKTSYTSKDVVDFLREYGYRPNNHR